MNDGLNPPKHARKRLRLTLGVMMLLIVAMAGSFAWVAQRAKAQRLAVARILKSPGATVRYDWQSENPKKSPDRKPRGPKWLRDLLGTDVFDSVAAVRILKLDPDAELLVEVGKLRQLESLSIIGADTPIPAKLASQVAPLKNLRTFTLSQIPGAEVFLPYFADKVQLTSLSMPTGAPSDADMAFLSKLASLEHLHLDGSRITDAGFTHLTNLKSIRSLNLRGVKLSSLEPLRGHKLLATLDLDNPTDSTEGRRITSLEPLHDLPDLIHVELGKNPIDDAGIRKIGILPKLTFLDISSSHLSADGVRELSRQPFLQTLMIGGSKLTETALMPLAEAPKLNQLGLYNAGVKDLRLLRPLLERLTTLNITNTPLQDDGLIGLAGLRSLQNLGFTGCSITEAGFAKIDKLPSLLALSLVNIPFEDSALRGLARFPGLRVLALSGTKVTDSGLAELVKVPGLVTLNLFGDTISDAAIPSLLRLPRLRMLSIEGTTITPNGEAQLKNARPGLRILKFPPRKPS